LMFHFALPANLTACVHVLKKNIELR
jgi:hypothetical protein